MSGQTRTGTRGAENAPCGQARTGIRDTETAGNGETPAAVVGTAKDGAAIDLTAGTPDASRFPFALWSRLMRQVLAEEDSRLLAPLPAAGVPALREAIADYLSAVRGISASPEQIVIGAGTEYCYQLLLLLLGRGRVYGLEDPGHTKIARIYRLNGVKIRPIPVGSEGVRLDALADSDVDVLHLSPNHHFPTGAVTSAAGRRALLRWVGEGNRTLIEDDYDSEFRFSGRPIPPLFDLDTSGRVIYVNTFTKTIAPSMRISYIVLPPALLPRYRERLGFYACPVPAFEQHALARFLSGGFFESHLHRMRAFYRARRDAVLDVLRASPFADRLTVGRADSGLHFLVRVRTERSDDELRALAARVGIRAAFLQDFRIDAGEGARTDTHTLVLSYSGLDPAALAAALDRLARMAENPTR